MSDPLYKKEILRLAADAHGAGHIGNADAAGSARNPVCGDAVSVELALDESRHVLAVAHETKACVLTQASASILGRDLKGASCADVEVLREAVAAMLASHSGPPDQPFTDYGAFEGVVEHRNRHTCVLLPIDAVLAAFRSLEVAKPRGVGSQR